MPSKGKMPDRAEAKNAAEVAVRNWDKIIYFVL